MSFVNVLNVVCCHVLITDCDSAEWFVNDRRSQLAAVGSSRLRYLATSSWHMLVS